MTEREYLIIPASAVPLIDFDTVCETSASTLRYSVDGAWTFVKWDGEQPAWTMDIADAQGPFDHEQILAILSGPEWTSESFLV